MHLVQVIERRQEIANLGAEVVLVAYDEPSLLHAKMMRGLSTLYPLLLDAEKAVYAR